MPDFQQAVDSGQSNQLALLSQQLTTLSNLVERNYRDTSELIRTNHADIKSDLQDHEQRIRSLEKTTEAISARVALTQILQTVFAVIASAIAATVGAIVK